MIGYSENLKGLSKQHRTRKKYGHIKCPECGTDARLIGNLGRDWQMRKCKGCGKEFVYSYGCQGITSGESNWNYNTDAQIRKLEKESRRLDLEARKSGGGINAFIKRNMERV